MIKRQQLNKYPFLENNEGDYIKKIIHMQSLTFLILATRKSKVVSSDVSSIINQIF